MATKTVAKVKTGIVEQSPGERRMVFVMSDETVDRAGDIVKVDGWQLDGFRKNPVFLSQHASDRFPLGVWEKVWTENGKLMGLARFADAGTHPEADLAYSLYKQGIMNAVSVRFVGMEYEPNEHGGLTFTSQELLECSAVSVPANPNALAVAKGFDKAVQELFLTESVEGPDGADGVQRTGGGALMEPEAEPKDGLTVSDEGLENILRALEGE